ncbi:MAG: MBOAT family protein [Bacteroidales bacterium]|nr:MBOAT family protein [Bacteroidales bacterium]
MIKNLILTVFSYIFYAWGEPMWIILLIFSSLFDYFNGILIYKWRGHIFSKVMVIVSIVGNLSLLLAFKYGGFIWENINFFVELPFPKPENTLPIGISFYTFQTISYTIDVYRKIVKPQYNIINFLMFVSLFTQLVAGPIVRYKTITREIENRKINWDDIWSGVSRFSIGMFKKVLIANTAGMLVEKYLDAQYFNLSIPEAWFGITMFSVQLYFDFSGYSDMAIGLGRVFGFHFDENFKHPYAATSVADFYRRWHISLGRFFRDYVYIPLGGNRRKQDRNIMIVWLLTGLWHGASWNFVLWGGYFGCFMIIEKYSKSILDKTPLAIKHLYTIILIIFSRAIFYFVDFDKLRAFIGILFTSKKPINPAFYSDLSAHSFLFILVIILCIPWNEILAKDSKIWIVSTKFYNSYSFAINILLLALSTIMLVDATYNPFIYFRF